jgi:hypothetical protein
MPVLATKAKKRSFDASITQGFFFGWHLKLAHHKRQTGTISTTRHPRRDHPACHEILNQAQKKPLYKRRFFLVKDD